VRAAKLVCLCVSYDEKGHPIEERVSFHATAIGEILNLWNLESPDKPLEIENLQSYEDFLVNGVGAHLLPLPEN